MNHLTPEEISRFQKKEEAIDTLTRLRGMFGACIYLMGGREQALINQYEDFEVWFRDIRDQLDDTIDVIGEIR